MRTFQSILLAAILNCTPALLYLPGSLQAVHPSSKLIECTLSPIQRTVNDREGVSPLNLLNEATSTNWSGYIGASSIKHPVNGSVSAVSGSWTIPVLQSTSNTSYVATWVGIDGFSSNTVEQLGTEQTWVNGTQQNYAWFEMYPQGSYAINGFPVNNGDVISASVHYEGGGTFLLIIENLTHGVFYMVPTHYTHSTTAKRCSAEWIVEAPYSNGVLPLADFGNATFTNCTATIGGIYAPISNHHWQNESLEMVTTGAMIKALPSPVGMNMDFMVTWEHE